MNLANVMIEIGARLATLPATLRVFDYPPDDIKPPAAIVSYPEHIEYDKTYGRGMDKIVGVPVVLLVDKVTTRTARDRIGAYADGSGANSVRALLHADGWVACDVVAVTGVDFDVQTIAGVDYMAAIFTCDIFGQGSS